MKQSKRHGRVIRPKALTLRQVTLLLASFGAMDDLVATQWQRHGPEMARRTHRRAECGTCRDLEQVQRMLHRARRACAPVLSSLVVRRLPYHSEHP